MLDILCTTLLPNLNPINNQHAFKTRVECREDSDQLGSLMPADIRLKGKYVCFRLHETVGRTIFLFC